MEGIADRLPSSDQLKSRPLDGLRVGVLGDTLGEGVDQATVDMVRAAAAHLEELGATVEHVVMPAFKSALPAYYIIASSEASSNLSRCVSLPCL